MPRKNLNLIKSFRTIVLVFSLMITSNTFSQYEIRGVLQNQYELPVPFANIIDSEFENQNIVTGGISKDDVFFDYS
ncbi:MAG: hypothetical protein AAF348_03245 [Bacteroidota bacterium]